MDVKKEKVDLILKYVDEEECICLCKNIFELYNCENCTYFKQCYKKAKSEYTKEKHNIKKYNIEGCEIDNEDENSVFAKAINFGGYKTEDEFWNELFE